MIPIALAFKDYRINPFTGKASAEVMIIHLCSNCQIIKTNRIAGDDLVSAIINLLEKSIYLDKDICNKIKHQNIRLVQSKDKKTLYISLLGDNYASHI